eukprot:277684-Amphidinium_carterae.1
MQEWREHNKRCITWPWEDTWARHWAASSQESVFAQWSCIVTAVHPSFCPAHALGTTKARETCGYKSELRQERYNSKQLPTKLNETGFLTPGIVLRKHVQAMGFEHCNKWTDLIHSLDAIFPVPATSGPGSEAVRGSSKRSGLC